MARIQKGGMWGLLQASGARKPKIVKIKHHHKRQKGSFAKPAIDSGIKLYNQIQSYKKWKRQFRHQKGGVLSSKRKKEWASFIVNDYVTDRMWKALETLRKQ